MKHPSINIIGAGNLGHLWTACLQKKSVSVQLYAREPRESLDCQVRSPQQIFDCKIHYRTLSEWQPADFIIICVKATHLETLCQLLQPVMQKKCSSSPILLMMNGMGIIEIAQRAFPQSMILQAATSHGARLDKNQLLHTGQGETLIGQIETNSINQTNKPLNAKQIYEPLVQLLNHSLAPTRWNQHHLETLWSKLLINSIINPLTAIYGVPNGQLIEDHQLKQKAQKLAQQLSPIIERYLPSQTWQSLFKKVERVAEHTYTNISSMYQDILQQRKTEIDFISGYLLKKASEMQVDLPEHQKVVKKIKRLEKTTQ